MQPVGVAKRDQLIAGAISNCTRINDLYLCPHHGWRWSRQRGPVPGGAHFG